MNGHGVECVQLNLPSLKVLISNGQFVQMSVGFIRGTREPPNENLSQEMAEFWTGALLPKDKKKEDEDKSSSGTRNKQESKAKAGGKGRTSKKKEEEKRPGRRGAR